MNWSKIEWKLCTIFSSSSFFKEKVRLKNWYSWVTTKKISVTPKLILRNLWLAPNLKYYLFQLLHEVVPIMIAYALVGAFSAVVQLASVAASAAYVAQISRRRLREKQQSWVSRNQLEIQVQLPKFYYPRKRIIHWERDSTDDKAAASYPAYPGSNLVNSFHAAVCSYLFPQLIMNRSRKSDLKSSIATLVRL